jgi:YD repeat-containing protein
MKSASRVVVLASVCLVLFATLAFAQTNTYHLHSEDSGDFCCYALKTSGPDAAPIVLQSGDLKGLTGTGTLRNFQTLAGIPSLVGTIPANSTVSFTLYMRKTVATGGGTIAPRATVSLSSGATVATCTGAALGTTLQAMTFNCTTTASVSMSTSDRVRVAVGYSITSSPTKSVKVELGYEGNATPTYPSRAVVPNPTPPTPVITSLNPSSAPLNWPITISGSNFGQSEGVVKFYNNITATIDSWSDTTIQTHVPANVATGPVTVTSSSNVTSAGSTFTLLGPPTVTSLSASSAHVNESITITGTNFMSTQSTSTVKFNGTTATPTSWSATSIQVPVPAGATNGNVVVTVSGQSSNGLPFTVIPPPTVLSAVPSSAQIGAAVTISGSYFGATQGSSTVVFNNGVTATPTSWSNTRITTTVPAGASTGNIVVNVANQASNGLAFTVLVAGTMSGTVTRVTGGTGISGATVHAVLTGVVRGTATTAADGTYSISGLDPGTYDVRIYATGFSTELRQGIVVTSTSNTTVNVSMYQPGAVSGRVTQPDGITPIAGAAITVYDGPMQKGSTSTNPSGDYTVNTLRPGGYTVQAVSVGYRTSEQGATITENITTTKNFTLSAAPSGPVLYGYDALGRLVQVTDPSGDSAIYRYDPVGNITAIERTGGGAVAISAFTPTSGAVATNVTINGTGFSATPSQNTVTFNGASLSVTASTATQIVATIPAGATVGTPYPFVVTTPTGSATSLASFTVLTTGGPTISTVSPATAASGTAMTVTGTNFETVTANNNLRVNLSPVQVSTATSTNLQGAVPPSATAGRVSVSTPNGTGTSTGYLWVAPPPYPATALDTTGTLSFGTSSTFSVAINKIALRVFEGTEAHRVSMNITGVTGGQANAYLYEPFGTALQTMFISIGSGFMEPVNLRSTATYSVVFDPATTTQVAGATVTVYDVPADFGDTIDPDETVPVVIEKPGQNGTLTFAGTAQQRVSLKQETGSTLINQIVGCDVNASILKPDGTVLAPATCMESSGFIETAELATSGTYKIVIDPVSTATGTLPLKLYSFTDVTSSIAFASPLPVPLVPGQNASLTFTGADQQHITLQSSGISGQIVGCDLNVSIVRISDAMVVVPPTCMEGNGFIGNTPLPSAGTYRIVVDPVSFVAGTVTLTLNDVTAPAPVPIAAAPPLSAGDRSAEVAQSIRAWPPTNVPATEPSRLRTRRSEVVLRNVGIRAISP